MPLVADDVTAAAEAVGFDAAAVIPLDAAGEDSLTAWLAAGHAGTMEYLERHAALRRDPLATFPGFRSAVIAVAEYGDAGRNPTDPSLGNVSRYALSDDYHALMKSRLRALGEALRGHDADLRTRALVDANPLNEKLLAQAGGLGFVGKHSNLIRERQGSWLFCGVLLLSVRLDGRAGPAKNRCGTCARCIAACPTAAIVEPYVVDARRCISYLTIELKGAIPHEFRKAIGNRIFGCDDCQEVCPWNRFAHRGAKEPFRPREGLQGRSLAEWLSIDEVEFDRIFEGSAVLRAGYSGFVRNVLVAAGNSGDSSLFAPVAARIHDRQPLLRAHAAWALGALGGPDARALLRRTLETEVDQAIRSEIESALADPTRPENLNPDLRNSEKK